MNGQYREGDIVFGKWKLVRKIGEGSFGKVFEAEREDFGELYKAAIKIITIPKDSAEIDNARYEGMDDESIYESLKSVAKDISKEFALMSKLKGTSHVVSYEDHDVLAHDNGFGWDIMLRMELLTPLKKRVAEGRLSDEEIVKMGVDMCKALELCQKHDIIHRDIKPENIFISDDGNYKLGDFGIARKLDGTSGFMTQTGTYSYMAPEIVRREKYGPAVDIYSLGLVMYTLLNNNRGVFLPAYPAPIMKSDREEAFERRMSGEKLPAPINAESGLTEVMLKACAFKPEDRYASPTEMRQALEACLNRGVVKPIIDDDDDKTVIEPKVEIKPVEENKTEIIKEQKTEQKPEEKSEVVLDKKYFENLVSIELQKQQEQDKGKASKKKRGGGLYLSRRRLRRFLLAVIVVLVLAGVVVSKRDSEQAKIADTSNTVQTKTGGSEVSTVVTTLAPNVKRSEFNKDKVLYEDDNIYYLARTGNGAIIHLTNMSKEDVANYENVKVQLYKKDTYLYKSFKIDELKKTTSGSTWYIDFNSSRNYKASDFVMIKVFLVGEHGSEKNIVDVSFTN